MKLRPRSGATLVEVLLAFALSTLVLAGAVGMFSSLNTMARASDLSAALQEAGLALAQIEGDLRRAVARPDAAAAVSVSARAVQLVRAEPASDGTVSGQLVVYEKEGASPGEIRIRRTCGASAGLLPGRYQAVAMTLLSGAGGPFLRVRLTVAARPGADPAGPGSAVAESSALVRVGGYELRRSAFLDWSFLDGVKAVTFR